MSAVEAVDAAIDRIEAVDPLVHALVAERFDAARDEAAGPLGDGPFAGVPYLVKALGAQVTGLPTSRGLAPVGRRRRHRATASPWPGPAPPG